MNGPSHAVTLLYFTNCAFGIESFAVLLDAKRLRLDALYRPTTLEINHIN